MIFKTIPLNRQSPRSFARTIPFYLKRQASIVQAIPINRHPVKTIFKTLAIDRQCPRSFVWTIPIN